ncbi:MAG: hypothetical protein QNJ63_09905 [Calothrix sp. MO_192.B10]|nr:hypothetical protein [Calothrix sp. MO_192.B10]
MRVKLAAIALWYLLPHSGFNHGTFHGQGSYLLMIALHRVRLLQRGSKGDDMKYPHWVRAYVLLGFGHGGLMNQRVPSIRR